MSEITGIDSPFTEGFQQIEEAGGSKYNEIEIKAVRIFMAVHNGQHIVSYNKTHEMNSWGARQVRTFLPAVWMVLFLTGNIYGFSAAVLAMFATRIACEKFFGEPNRYSRQKLESVVYQIIQEFSRSDLDPDRIRRCTIEVDATLPHKPFVGYPEKSFTLCTLDGQAVKQIFY